MHQPRDPFDLDLSRYPILTPTDERAAIDCIATAYASLRRQVVSVYPAARGVVEVLERVAAKEVRSWRVLALGDARSVAGVAERLPALRNALEALRVAYTGTYADRERAANEMDRLVAEPYTTKNGNPGRLIASAMVASAEAGVAASLRAMRRRGRREPPEAHGSGTKMLRIWRSRVVAARAELDGLRSSFAAANLRLVLSIARKMSIPENVFPLADLIQAGVMGLMKAIDYFEAGRGNRFSTYATWWVRQTIGRYICQFSRLIRSPVHVLGRMNRGDADENQALDTILSIDNTASEALCEIIAAPPHDPHDDAEAIELRERLVKVMAARLNFRERAILRARFGIGCRPRTLEEIGDGFGISRERVRQLEQRAIYKLRFVDGLKGFRE